MSNDEAQLNRFKTLFPMLWLHPAVKGITLWGYKQYHIWRKNAYLVRTDGTERPALTWLKQYLQDYHAVGALNSAPRSHSVQALWVVGSVVLMLILGTCAWLFLKRSKARQ